MRNTITILLVSVAFFASSTSQCFALENDALSQWIGTWDAKPPGAPIIISEFDGELQISGSNVRNIKLSSDGQSLKFDWDQTMIAGGEIVRIPCTDIWRMNGTGVVDIVNSNGWKGRYYKQ
jgi:hypothetical protein